MSESFAPRPAQASITVLEPNGGEVWPIGALQTIRWTSSGVLGDVQIRINRGGSTWQTLFSRIPNSGSVQWTVTGPTTTSARLRVISLVNSNIRDDGNVTFNITNDPVATITVVSPNDREVWPVNTTQTIQWTSSNLTGNVKIDLSRNGGAAWETLWADTPNDGSQSWMVTGPDAAQCQIRISSVTNSAVTDASDDLFLQCEDSVVPSRLGPSRVPLPR